MVSLKVIAIRLRSPVDFVMRWLSAHNPFYKWWIQFGKRMERGAAAFLNPAPSSISGAAETGCPYEQMGSDIGRVSEKVFITRERCWILFLGRRVTLYSLCSHRR